MTASRSSLADQFAEVEDAELVRRVESGQLTELARDVAMAELSRRGIGLPIDTSDPADPADAEAVAANPHNDMCLLVTFNMPTEAHILVARLQAEGIHAMAADAHLVQANPLLGIAVGGVRVLVAEGHLAHAREILEAMRDGELDADRSESGVAPASPDCPRCGGAQVSTRLAGFFRSLVLWNDAPRWRCAGCGHTWPSSI